MAQSVIITDTGGAGKVRKVRIVWVADASGVVSTPLTNSGTDLTDSIPITGLFVGAESTPGSPAPTAGYNKQVRRGSATGRDLLSGSGAGRSATDIEMARPKDGNGNAIVEPLRDDRVYFTISGAGAGGAGTDILSFLQP